MLPSKQQWKKWSLPSKYSLIGVVLGLIGLLLTIISMNTESNLENKLENGKRETHYRAKRISRAEFLFYSISYILPNKIIPEPIKNPFHDVQIEYKYAKEIDYAKKLGIISNNYRFNPEEEISRKEMAKILSNTICIARKNTSKSCSKKFQHKITSFKDIDKLDAFFKPYIYHLVNIGVIRDGENFFPNNPLSHLEAKELINKANESLKYF